jgi:hypothetical protein
VSSSYCVAEVGRCSYARKQQTCLSRLRLPCDSFTRIGYLERKKLGNVPKTNWLFLHNLESIDLSLFFSCTLLLACLSLGRMVYELVACVLCVCDANEAVLLKGYAHIFESEYRLLASKQSYVSQKAREHAKQ